MKQDVYEALARGYCTKKNEDKTVDPSLIEAMAVEVVKLYDELYLINKMQQMAEESLPPERFEEWMLVKDELFKNRKYLKGSE